MPDDNQLDSQPSVAERLQQFSASRDPQLRARLIEDHLELVERLARRFTSRGESFDDLVQAGSIGLIKAVDHFNPDLGYEFVAYASTTILGELKRHFRDHGWSIRASRRVQELYLELAPTVETLTHRFGRSPTIREVATEIGTSEEAVLEAMEAGVGYRAPSLDAPGPEGRTLGDRVGEQDSNFELAERRATVMPELAALPERDRRLITMRFVEELSQVEIAQRLGISQMHVSRLLAKSIAKLHRAVESPSDRPGVSNKGTKTADPSRNPRSTGQGARRTPKKASTDPSRPCVVCEPGAPTSSQASQEPSPKGGSSRAPDASGPVPDRRPRRAK